MRDTLREAFDPIMSFEATGCRFRGKEEGGGKGERGDGACCLKRGASVGNERVKGGGACVEH